MSADLIPTPPLRATSAAFLGGYPKRWFLVLPNGELREYTGIPKWGKFSHKVLTEQVDQWGREYFTEDHIYTLPKSRRKRRGTSAGDFFARLVVLSFLFVLLYFVGFCLKQALEDGDAKHPTTYHHTSSP